MSLSNRDLDDLTSSLQNIRLNDAKESSGIRESIRGICMTMCPIEEMEIRKQQCLVHPLESTLETASMGQRYRRCDHEKMVKCYSRPAAGKEFARPEILRPFPVLRRTISYLLSIVDNNQHPWDSIYDFVSDRLRATRQDMIIQEFDPKETTILLSLMIPFYFFSKYKCETEGCSTYDKRLHQSQMDECVDRYFDSYFDIQTHDIKECDQGLVRLLLLYRLNSNSFWLRIIDSPLFESEPGIFAGVIRIYQFYHQGNYVAFFRKFRKLPLLERLAVSAGDCVVELRRRSFRTLKRAYGRSKIPVEIILRWFDFLDGDDAIACLNECGFEIDENSVYSNGEPNIDRQCLSTSPSWFRWPDDDLNAFKLCR